MYENNFRPFMMPRNIPYIPNINPGITRPPFSTNLFSSIFKGAHNINWNGMLNNISRTLGVVREAIPVVKEVGPMVNNMKSMIKIASVFKDETDTKKTNHTNIQKNTKQENSTNNSTTPNNIPNYNNEPNFFL